MADQTISIIIPTFNEEAIIARTLQRLIAITERHEGVEIIVSDASTDSTPAILSDFAVTINQSAKGRSTQMNGGAALARGEILYFLHADTLPPESFIEDILTATAAGKRAGCFRMDFDDNDPIMTLYGWFTQFPLMLFRGGDQSLFMERSLFNEIKGFDESLLVMEDIDIINRIERQAAFHILENHVTTSSRKFHDNGIIRLQLIFGTIHLMYALGFDQESIVKYYRENIT